MRTFLRARAPRTALLAVLFLAIATPSVGAPASLSVSSDFAEGLDLDEFRLVAVQDQGRVKTFDSLAREKLKYVNARLLRDVDPVTLYLDMVLVPENYANAELIRIKNEVISQRLAEGVRSLLSAEERTGIVSDEELDRIEDGGYVSQAFLNHPAARSVLRELERDLRRSGKAIGEINRSLTYSNPRALRAMMAVVPPPGGGELDRWYSLDAAMSGSGAPRDAVHAGMGGGVPGLDPATVASLRDAWSELQRAWRFQEAAAANAALETLATALAGVEPALYPEESRLDWEHWYYKRNKLTGGWLLYFFAIPFLLMAFVYGFRWARWVGLAMFALSFAVHTFSLGLRWYFAGRIPNANMFEAIIASAWFGALCAIVLEYLLRRHRLRFLSALVASVYAMLAMMFGRYMTVSLSGDITTVMPVLDRTIWLYIHVNVIIASYALIFFAGLTGLWYLLGRGLGAFWPGRFGKFWNDGAFASGGATSIIMSRREGDADANPGLARTLDGATMIFLEVAFISLWVGTILGAVWADVSWGRPWGWDPKEVFALNTWLVFLVLIHVRFKVKDKGFWTAILAVVGLAVMLFNWIAVNFVIVGLHSYA